ncbi:MAG: phospholipid carrier-dependent glycosyltransferase [Puniceicoccales bacterium]
MPFFFRVADLACAPKLVGMFPERNRILRRDFCLLGLIFGVLFFGTLWVRPLANPDEGRYSEIPREMLESGDWVLPRLNGILYFYKPPLPYWLQAGAQGVAGNGVAVQRFWPAAVSWLGVLGTFLAARYLYGRGAAWLSALILGSCLLYFGLSQILTLDPYVSVFMTLALFCYIIGIREPRGRRRLLLFAGFYSGISLAVMSKGFMAIAIPGAIIFLWFLLLNQWRKLRDLHLVMGALIFLVIAGPWHLAAALSSEHWFDFYVVHEHFERYLSDVSDRAQPAWYFLVLLPIAFLPWTVFLPGAVVAILRNWREREAESPAWFLLIWSLFVVLFFSASQSKLPTYILPVMPPLAVLTGRYLAALMESGAWVRLRRPLWALAGLLGALAVALPILVWVRADEFHRAATPWTVVAMVSLALGGFAVARGLARGRNQSALLAAFVAIMVTLFCFNGIASGFQQPGTRAFADFLKPKLVTGDRVFHFADYFQDFPFYLEQPVDLLFQEPKEQAFGAEWEPEQAARYVPGDQVAAVWSEPGRKFALAHADALRAFQILYPEQPVYVWRIDNHFVLFSNEPSPHL